jgi:hypothetical protein
MDMYRQTPLSDQEPTGPWAVTWLDVLCAWLLAVVIVLLTLLT